jgi:hypothetical protein
VSGSIAALGVGAFSLAADLSFGAQTVSLGSFVFDRWEIPEHIEWGGTQHLTVHKLIGGARVIDAMGRDDADLTWSGVFLSPDASLRADQVDQMRIGGQVYPLIFAGRYYDVVIADFHADQRKPWHVPYHITCTVLRDGSNPAANAPSLLSQVLNDVITAEQIFSNALALATAAIVVVNALLGSAPAIISGTARAAAIAQALANTQAEINAAQATADATIATLTAASVNAGTVLGATAAPAAIAALVAAAQAAQDAAAAAAMAAYVNRAARNVSEA